ncbi:MAG: hypothetical protein BWY39_01740 [Spirochaetes bacterium ADurb.Bin269]|nr:MAG: hypothetical protein BWY39_01740 [Spirochaetes bacterium ADurb.Bin269]
MTVHMFPFIRRKPFVVQHSLQDFLCFLQFVRTQCFFGMKGDASGSVGKKERLSGTRMQNNLWSAEQSLACRTTLLVVSRAVYIQKLCNRSPCLSSVRTGIFFCIGQFGYGFPVLLNIHERIVPESTGSL